EAPYLLSLTAIDGVVYSDGKMLPPPKWGFRPVGAVWRSAHGGGSVAVRGRGRGNCGRAAGPGWRSARGGAGELSQCEYLLEAKQFLHKCLHRDIVLIV